MAAARVLLLAHAGLHRIPSLTAHPLSLLVLATGVVTSALAAIVFVGDIERPKRRAEHDDVWVALFATSVMLIVVAPNPSTGSPFQRRRARLLVCRRMWLAALCFMSVGALRQLAVQRRLTAADLAERDRKRLARDLHDGICQDLAFIAAHGARLAREEGDDHPIAVAARRALAASRGTSRSCRPMRRATRQALQRVADELVACASSA